MKIEILSVRNPQWVNEDYTAIDCLITTNMLKQEVPFTATLYDEEIHGREIFFKCLLGEFGEIAPMKPKPFEQPLPKIHLPVWFQLMERFLIEANQENSRKSIRGIVSVWGSLLDDLLKEMLEAEKLGFSTVEKKSKQDTFNAHINQAFKRGLIDKEESDKCHHIRLIRNAFAHKWEPSLIIESILPNLRALYEADHSKILIFHEELEFLIQHVYSSSCSTLVIKFCDRIATNKH